MSAETPAATSPRPFGPYELLSCLGQGSSGEAHLARPGPRSEGVPSPTVLKRLHARIEQNAEFVRRFRHEAAIAVQVESAHVARVWDAGRVEDRLYIALEYVPGWTLGRLLGTAHRTGGFPLGVSLQLAEQLARGLADLHAATDARGQPLEFVHRDLAPKNIMVGDDGRLRIIDLGLGKSRAQDWRTRAGRVMGSPGYMPPEQIAGETVGQAADVYAAGVVIYELLSAKRYIPPGDPVSMLQEALRTPYRSLRGLRPEVPAQLDALLEAAMHPDPTCRLARGDLLRAGLEELRFSRRPGQVSAWLQGELRDEQRARHEETRRLLSLPRARAEPEQLVTVLFAQRRGVHHQDLAPSLAKPGSSPDSEMPSVPMASASRPVRSGEGTRLVLSFLAGLIAGAVLMAAFFVAPSPRSAPVVVETPAAVGLEPAPELAAPAVSAPSEAGSSPAREVEITPSAKEAPAVTPARPSKRSRPRAQRALPSSRPPERPEELPRGPGLAVRIERLSARANALRRHPEPRVASAAARALAQLSLVARMPSRTVQRARLTEIEAVIEDLETLRDR